MNMCPKCSQEAARRKNGACPHCGTPIQIFDGHWFVDGPNSPVEQLIHRFEDRMTDHLSTPGSPVVFRTPKHSLRMAQAGAAHLLKLANYDLELALEAVDLCFQHPRMSWKTRNTLQGLVKDFPAALAIAQALRDKRQQAEKREQKVLAEIMAQEDIFA